MQVNALPTRWPASGRLRSLPVALGPVALACLLTVLAWPIAYSKATATLDEAWMIGLHVAFAERLRYGVDILFTYGPLGFLGSPRPYVDWTSSLALVANIAIYLGLIGTLLAGARRILPWWGAAVVTLLAARFFVVLPPFEALQALVFTWCVEALADRMPLRSRVIPVSAGILAGITVLTKVNIGIWVVLMLAVTIAVVSRSWWKGLAAYLVTLLATALGLWVILGQRLTDLGAFAAGTYQIVAGYNDAVGTVMLSTRSWIWIVLAAVAALVVWSGWWTSRDWPRPRRIGLLLLGLVIGFAMWKTVVVRDHASYVFATAMAAMFVFSRGFERRTWLIGVLAVGVALAGAAAIEPGAYADVVGSSRSIAFEIRDAIVPGRGTRAAATTRHQLGNRFRLDSASLAAIGDATVTIDPLYMSAAFAYPELHWKPLPVFQSYSAYTPALDQLNADLLRSDSAPERILRSFRSSTLRDLLRLWLGRSLKPGEVLPATVDGHFRWFEQPATTLEMFCRYGQVAATDSWQVLAPTGRTCGPPEPLGTVSAKAGAPVTVPLEARPDRFVIVKITGMEPSLLGRVRAALTRGQDWWIRLGDSRYRLIQATAADGLLMAVPPAADGSPPFAFGPPIQTIAVAAGLSGRDSSATLTYEFLSVPLQGP
jgi:hypothetical protein